jgi:hypothetical protein
MTFDLTTLSLGLGLAGLCCFLWPILQRINGNPQPQERSGLRSPLWWAGLVLTALAVYLQRMAVQ